MPLVAITQDDKALETHFKDDYIQEIISQYIDYMNITYVAFTRPKYRLYTYGTRFENEENPQQKITNIGQLISSFLYQEKTTNDQGEEKTLLQQAEDGSWYYHIEDAHPEIKDNDDQNEEEDEEVETIQTIQANYVSSPINDRLVLRSRAEDDFNEDTELETIDLGILMHEWLADIITWDDAEPALEKMRIRGRITTSQEEQLKEQMHKLQTLLQHENKGYWFDGSMQIINERTIISTNGKSYRPDRIVIRDKYAEVIDYKFGHEHSDTYDRQLRRYTLLLQQMGYTVNAYIVYTALQKIHKI
jgi:ATP-dependent exoDNAse (exonuclease V) beta subunit